MTRFPLILLALGIGILITAVITALSYFASELGVELLSDVLFWPNALMQGLVPLHNIGIPEQPFYEGTPLNIAAFFLSFPLAVLAYGTGAYLFLRRRQRMRGSSTPRSCMRDNPER